MYSADYQLPATPLPSLSQTSYDHFEDFYAKGVSVSASRSTLGSVDADNRSYGNCSESNRHSTCSSPKSNKKKKVLDQHVQLQETFSKVLSESSQRERDTVDSFLGVLGDLLRHLPYITRRKFQRRILDLAITEEDKVLNKENVQ